MADLKKVRETIREISRRRKNVQADEIDWVVKHLAMNGFQVVVKESAHGRLFRISNVRFGVCRHNPGGKQIKPCYVDGFLDAMEELGLYEQ